MLTEDVKQAINLAFKKAFSWQPKDIELVNPEPIFGDFALACHPFARALKLSPQEIASRLADNLAGKNIVKAEAAAGYLNITVGARALGEEAVWSVIEDGKHYGSSGANKEKILLEYSSPNTNKPLHLGHIRNNVLGMALSRLLEAQGAQVIKTQIINDRGIHIMKSLVAYQKLGNNETPERTGEKGDHFVGRFYVLFSEETMMADAKEALRQWEAGDKEIRDLWEKMNQWVYGGYEITYRDLGSEFDKNYYESQAYLLGKKIIEQGLRSGVFYKESDGSVWINLEDVGLDKKVLQRSDGTSVYMTQDLGLAAERQKEFKFDSLIYIVGHEQEYHFKVLFEIFKRLGYDWSANLRHLAHALVYLPEGKMKSREGRVVDADEIIKEVKDLALAEVKKRSPELPESEAHERSAAIGLGALKFFLLRVTPTQSIHFNPAEAIAFEGSTGPYVQYAHARIASILKEETPLPPNKIDFSKLTSPEEKTILLKLLTYPRVTSQAANLYSPNLVCDYLVSLSQAFNTFYHQHQVLRAEDEETKHARLLLIKAVQIVLRNGLRLLGIAAPEKM